MSEPNRDKIGGHLSPIVPLLPTGYRDIQPFQRGQAWHSNGSKINNKLRPPRDEIDIERVVFPAIQRASDLSAELLITDIGREEDGGDGPTSSSIQTAMSPTPRTPTKPSVPRRPMSGRSESNQRSFPVAPRGRWPLASASPRTTPKTKSIEPYTHGDNDNELLPPNPLIMEQLLQEYAERTKASAKVIDQDVYHRKMHHRYTDMKALRERIGQLVNELEETRRERDESRDVARRQVQQQAALIRVKEINEEDGGLVGEEEKPEQSSQPARIYNVGRSTSFLSTGATATTVMNPEELSYREKCCKLEKSLAVAKESVVRMENQLLTIHGDDCSTIQSLHAKIKLQEQANNELSIQLRETIAAFKVTTDELVVTQVALEKEQSEKQIIVDQIQMETRQLITDHKRNELQSRVRNVVRTLGKEALRQKMEALHTRVLIAEHHMRVAQLKVTKLQTERSLQQKQLDEILSSREIKYHCLSSQDGGIPGILNRCTLLYHGTRVVGNDQLLMVDMLYEDNRKWDDSNGVIKRTLINQNEDLDDGFAVHILIYDMFTAQDDYLTFHFRDIQRLIPDHEKYLARFADRRHERYLALAELLLNHCHIGFKNGHIVLTERPSTPPEATKRERQEITIYRGSQYLPVHASAKCPPKHMLVDLVVNEVCNPSMSQLWWLEVHAALMLGDSDNQRNDGSELECLLKIDHQRLKSMCPTFAGYRPSDSIHGVHDDSGEENPIVRVSGAIRESEVFSIHEELLEAVFEKMELQLRRHELGPLLKLRGYEDDTDNNIAQDTSMDTIEAHIPTHSKDTNVLLADDTADNEGENEMPNSLVPSRRQGTAAGNRSTCSTNVLDHRSIVGIDDIYYCLRIQEVWDGELMLHITMEEPTDAAHRFHVVLYEHQLVSIAEYLYQNQLCGANYSSVIKYGLPTLLHGPICKLLKRFILPNRLETSNETDKKVSTISITSLVEELNASALKASQCSVLDTKPLLLRAQSNHRRVCGHMVNQVHLLRHDTLTTLEMAEAILIELNTNLAHTGESTAGTVKRKRRGVRFRGSIGRFAVVTTYSGFIELADVVLLDILPISANRQATDGAPILVIAQTPIEAALIALGLHQP